MSLYLKYMHKPNGCRPEGMCGYLGKEKVPVVYHYACVGWIACFRLPITKANMKCNAGFI